MSWGIVFNRREHWYGWYGRNPTYKRGDFIEVWPERKCKQVVRRGYPFYKIHLPKVEYDDALLLLEPGEGRRRRRYRLHIRYLPKHNRRELRKNAETIIKLNNQELAMYIMDRKGKFADFIIQ
jgi:hypothetical protein